MNEEQINNEVQEQPVTPTLANRIEVMGLDEETAQRVTELTQGIADENVSDEMLATLARGVTHDDDVQNADAAGYLRGRNEKIEAVLHPQPQDADESHSTPIFPRYCRRSVWES